jgi:hypothetical protein
MTAAQHSTPLLLCAHSTTTSHAMGPVYHVGHLKHPLLTAATQNCYWVNTGSGKNKDLSRDRCTLHDEVTTRQHHSLACHGPWLLDLPEIPENHPLTAATKCW